MGETDTTLRPQVCYYCNIVLVLAGIANTVFSIARVLQYFLKISIGIGMAIILILILLAHYC